MEFDIDTEVRRYLGAEITDNPDLDDDIRDEIIGACKGLLIRLRDATEKSRDREWQRTFLADGMTEEQEVFQIKANASIPAGPEWLRGVIDDLVQEARDDTRDATEQADIEAVCKDCKNKVSLSADMTLHPASADLVIMDRRDRDYRSWGPPIVRGRRRCRATHIHERRRAREEEG